MRHMKINVANNRSSLDTLGLHVLHEGQLYLMIHNKLKMHLKDGLSGVLVTCLELIKGLVCEMFADRCELCLIVMIVTWYSLDRNNTTNLPKKSNG